MAEEVAAIGVKLETDGLAQGVRTLEQLAAVGPKVERSVNGIERAAGKSGKQLKTLGDGANGAASELGKLKKNAEDAERATIGVGDAMGALRAAVLGAGLVGLSREYFSLADAATNVQSRLKLVTDSTRELVAAQASLFKTAQDARVSYTGLVDTYAQMARSTKELGISQREMMGVTETISKAVTISGASAASAQAALIQLSQGFASGTLRGEELNSVMEQTPRLAMAIANGMGVGIGKLREMGQAGELTAEKVVKALQNSAGDVAAEFEQMAVTVEQATTTAGNSLVRLIGVFDQVTGASGAAAAGIGRFATGFDTLADSIKGMAESNSLADFFTSAFQSNANLNAELKISEAEMAKLTARLAKAPDNIYVRSQIAELQKYIAGLKEAQARLAALTGASVSGGATDPRDQSQFISRGASYANYAKQQEAARQGLLEISAKTNGVTKQFTGDLKAYEEALRTGVISTNDYVKAVTELNKKRYESTEAGKAEAKAAKDGAKGNKEGESAILSYIKSLEARTAAQRLEITQGEKLTESQRARIQLEALLADSKNKASKSQVANAQALLAESEANEAWLKNASDVEKALADMQKAREQSLRSVQDSVKKLVEEAEATAYAEMHNISLAEAVERLALARAENAYQQAVERQEAPATLDYLRQEIEARKQLVAATAQKGVKEANAKAAEQAAKDWERVSQTIGDTLADYIMGGGKDAAQYLKRLFATLVLQPIVNYGVQGVLGAIGMGGGSAGGSNAMGMLNNLSSLNTMYSAFSGSLTNSVGTAFSKAGQLFGSEALKSFGAGTQGAYLPAGVQGPVTGGSGAGIGASGVAAVAAVVAGMVMSNKLFAQGFSANNFSSSQKTWDFGTYYQTKIASNVFGEKWANILSGAPLGNFIWGKLGLGGNPKQHSGGVYTNTTSRDGALDVLGLTKHARGDFTSRQNGSIDSALASTIEGLVSVYEDLGARSETEIRKLAINAAFAINPINKKEDAYGYLSISDALTGAGIYGSSRRDGGGLGNDPEQAFNLFTGEIAGVLVQELIAADLPGWIDSILAGMGGNVTIAGLQSALLEIAKVDAAFAGFAKHIDGMQDLAGSVQTVLLSVSGGLDALTANVSSYYDNFYTASEKLEDQAAALEEVFSKYGTTMPTTAAQFRALMEQQLAAGDAGAEFAAVLLGINGAFKGVADAWETELGGMSGAVTSFFADLYASIDSLYADVADSRKDILRGTAVMTADEIRAAIAGTSLVGPSMSGVDAAKNASALAAADLAAAKSAAADADSRTGSAGQGLSGAVAQRDAYAAQMDYVRSTIDGERGALESYITGHRRKYGSKSYWMPIHQANIERLEAQLASMQPALAAYNDAVARQQAVFDAAKSNAEGYADALTAATAAAEAAKAAELAAQQAYAAEVSQYIKDAAGSVDKLSDLRGEVVSFYEAQVQAVQAMLQSAGNIRGVVDQLRLGQLTTAQTAAELGNRYAVDYAMALATTGSTRAGYVDAMAGNLGTLTEALKAESVTGADWRIETAKLFAQASNAAGLLEGDAKEDDYKDVALGLLDSIDTALAGLSDSTKSAEQVIADAISAGTEAQLSGLRAIVAALKGESIPAFATGGTHLGGLRIVGENGPELEATGPSRIWNAQQTAALFSGGGNTARLEALVAQLIEENRAQASAIVRLQQDLNRQVMRWDTQGLPREREEA